MRGSFKYLMLLGSYCLASCTPIPAVSDSREVLWGQFGNQPVDGLLLAWGPPLAETHLTDGSRLLSYQHSTTYEAQSPYERQAACKASFLAKAPQYRIADVALEGDMNECRLLSQGHTGDNRIVAVPTPNVYYPPAYHRYPF